MGAAKVATLPPAKTANPLQSGNVATFQADLARQTGNVATSEAHLTGNVATADADHAGVLNAGAENPGVSPASHSEELNDRQDWLVAAIRARLQRSAARSQAISDRRRRLWVKQARKGLKP